MHSLSLKFCKISDQHNKLLFDSIKNQDCTLFTDINHNTENLVEYLSVATGQLQKLNPRTDPSGLRVEDHQDGRGGAGLLWGATKTIWFGAGSPPRQRCTPTPSSQVTCCSQVTESPSLPAAAYPNPLQESTRFPTLSISVRVVVVGHRRRGGDELGAGDLGGELASRRMSVEQRSCACR